MGYYVEFELLDCAIELGTIAIEIYRSKSKLGLVDFVFSDW